MMNDLALHSMPEFMHGGQLEKIKLAHPEQPLAWIDLSTGMSPFAYPIKKEQLTTIDLTCLPQNNEQLEDAAKQYYGTQMLSVVPGSMWAIQMLPVMRKLTATSNKAHDDRPVLIPRQGFNEHEKAWRGQGYEVEHYDDLPRPDQLLRAQVCVIINPNNPTGKTLNGSELQEAHNMLSKNNGWLIVDEAFIDAEEYNGTMHSMAREIDNKGLIVLRSFGKFFGLAGLRLGAVIADQFILNNIAMMLNNWSINNVTQLIGEQAWLDRRWHATARLTLAQSEKRLNQLFTSFNHKTVGTVFFQTLYTHKAVEYYERLLEKGIYTRLLDHKNGLRFGLPKTESQWTRLETALVELRNKDI